MSRFDFTLHTAFGVVVAHAIEAVDDKAALLAQLHPDEAALAATWGLPRVRTFVAGRRALRSALAALHQTETELVGERSFYERIVRNDRGAPAIAVAPALDDARGRVRVSISHKDEIAVALAAFVDVDERRAADASFDIHLGVDVELFPGPKDDVSRHVLTDVEIAELNVIVDGDARRRELVARFSAKEALYKALDPFVHRYVGFHEVEVRLDGSGAARFALNLKHGEGPFVVEGAHRDIDGGVLTFARVSRSK
jgi:enterobactin synthetase component D